MDRRGLSARALASELGVSNATVSAWRRGARPHPSIFARLADMFGISIEVLRDDRLPLTEPINYPISQAHYMVEEPLRVAARAADMVAGPTEERQRAFEQFLQELRTLRAEAEQAARGDPLKAVAFFDRLLVAWMERVSELEATDARLDKIEREARADQIAKDRAAAARSRSRSPKHQAG